VPDPVPPPESLWTRLSQSLAFWREPREFVQCSIFAPAVLPSGGTVNLQVFTHAPDAGAGILTLARAFNPDTRLVGAGILDRRLVRGANLSMHFTVVGAGVAQPLQSMIWRGQPHALRFPVHAPWDLAPGQVPGRLSVGQDNVLVGQIDLTLTVVPAAPDRGSR
jgi:hypothetical protein